MKLTTPEEGVHLTRPRHRPDLVGVVTGTIAIHRSKSFFAQFQHFTKVEQTEQAVATAYST